MNTFCRSISLDPDGDGVWLRIGMCSVVYLTVAEARHLDEKLHAFVVGRPISAEGLETVHYESGLPHILPPLSPEQLAEADYTAEMR